MVEEKGPRTPLAGRAAPVAVLAVVLAGWFAAVPAASGTPRPQGPAVTPAYGGDFPDPSLMVAGGRYYAYSTQVGATNVPVMHSSDLVHWSRRSDALPRLPAWASPGSTWAPTVVAGRGGYLLYYTVRQTSSGRQCVSVATAAAPAGPFTDASDGPLVCQLSHGGSIDPSVFTDARGTAYLLWKSDDNALGQKTSLWSRPLAADGAGFARFSVPVRLLTQTAAWQAPAIEGPSMVEASRGFYLFYGAGDWKSSSSAIGYATCASPLGPCTDRSTVGPWLASGTDGAPPIGPQGPAVFVDGKGRTRLAFAAWNGPVGYPLGARALFTAPLSFPNGRPTLG
jgi:beta-xylosidase